MAGWSEACRRTESPFWDHDPFADFDNQHEEAGSSGSDGGESQDQSPEEEPQGEEGKCWNGSLGIQGSLHGPLVGPVGIGLSGGFSVGFSYGGSLLDSRLFLQFQGAGMAGTGIYGGVGASAQGGGGAVSLGISTTETWHSEASFGVGAGATAGVDVAMNGQIAGTGYHGRLPLGRYGFGVGAAAGTGVATTSTVGFGSFRGLLNWVSEQTGLTLPGAGTPATCD